jgi:hypothetical protein
MKKTKSKKYRDTVPLIAQENINGRDQFRILVRAVGYTIHGLIPASCVFADRHHTSCLTYNNEANIRGVRKTVHVVFKYFHAEACCRKGWGWRSNAFLPTPALFPSWSVDILLKDDVTVIILLEVSYSKMHLI